MDLFEELNSHHKTTFVIATHDQRVMAHVPRLIRMLDGRIVESGGPELALKLEERGYDWVREKHGITETA